MCAEKTVRHLFVLVDGTPTHGYSVRVVSEGFGVRANNQFGTLEDALKYAHMGFPGLPVILGQLSDGYVADLYRRLSAS